jgi:hypothetical protein
MRFCVLENDRKTFEYANRYAECFAEGRSCMELDNAIQADEVSAHMWTNQIPPANQEEKIRWVLEHGREFRQYLNTIKLIYVVWTASGRSWDEMTFEEFQKIEHRINNIKETCLDTIR